MKTLVSKLTLFTFLLLGIAGKGFAQLTYDWVGTTSTAWNVNTNWKLSTGLTPVTYPGTLSTDVVRIGTNQTFTNQPVLSTTLLTSITSLSLGTNGNSTSVMQLKINSALTVSGNITQASTSNNTNHRTAISGTGTLTCQGDVTIGNSTPPASGSVQQDSTTIRSLINQFTIQGNLNLISTASTDGKAVYFPAFELDANTVTLNGQITFTNNNAVSSSYTSTFAAPSRARFNTNAANNVNTLILNNVNPVVLPLLSNCGVDFNEAFSTSGVVNYNASGSGQAILNSSDGIGSAGGTYENLLLTGGTKTFDAGTMTVTVNMTTSSGAIDMTTNDPVITVGGNWTNTATVNEGSGTINVTGNLNNNSGGVINGNSTAATTYIGGVLTNGGTITNNAENMTFNGIGAANNNTITGGAGTITFNNSFSNNSGATFTAGAGTVTFSGSYANSQGTYNSGSGSTYFNGDYTNSTGASVFTPNTGMIYFNKAGAQTLNDNSTNGTTFNNVTFANSGTKSMGGSGGFAISNIGVLTMAGSATLSAGGVLTLRSDATSTAAVAPLANATTTTNVITGTVKVERYVSGGSGLRGYRLFSSAVNSATDSYSNKLYSFNYLQSYIYLTSTSTSGGFDNTAAANPTLYLYRENIAPLYTTFLNSNFRGINTINTAPTYGMDDSSYPTTNMIIGNGFLCFFRGNRASASFAAETTPSYTPVSVTMTSSGTLNQGPIAVRDWFIPSNAQLSYTNNTFIANANVRGFNLVGNPYASSIDWDNYTAGTKITYTALSPTIYTINPSTKQYNTYMAGDAGVGKGTTGVATGNNSANIIASGQGFFVRATNTGSSLTFTENAKVPTKQPSSGFSSLAAAVKPAAAAPQYMRLNLMKDTAFSDDMLVFFKPTASTKFSMMEDAEYLKGNGADALASLSADNIRLAINRVPLPKQKQDLTIPISLNVGASGRYTFKRGEIEGISALYRIWLIDNYLKDSLDIKNNLTYIFDVNKKDSASFGNKRFKLIFRQDPALGLHLLSFTATKASPGSQVAWKTENEQNYTNFTVERSTDNGKTFESLGTLLSDASGTYSFTDKNPVIGADEYRLKMIDVDSLVSYSSAITLIYSTFNSGVNIASSGISVYPNPAMNIINLTIDQGAIDNSKPAPSYSIKITNSLGGLVKSINSANSTWQDSITNLLPGTYIVQVVNNSDKNLVGKTKFVKL